MSDDDLAFETAHLAENIESLKTELHLWAAEKDRSAGRLATAGRTRAHQTERPGDPLPS